MLEYFEHIDCSYHLEHHNCFHLIKKLRQVVKNCKLTLHHYIHKCYHSYLRKHRHQNHHNHHKLEEVEQMKHQHYPSFPCHQMQRQLMQLREKQLRREQFVSSFCFVC